MLWAIINLVDEVSALFREILIEKRLIDLIVEDVERQATYEYKYIKRLYSLHNAIKENGDAKLIEESHELLTLLHSLIWEM